MERAFQHQSTIQFQPQFPEVILNSRSDYRRVTKPYAGVPKNPWTCMSNSYPNSSNLPQDQRELKLSQTNWFFNRTLLKIALFIPTSYKIIISSTHDLHTSEEDSSSLHVEKQVKYSLYKHCYLFFRFRFSLFIFLRCHFQRICLFFFQRLELLFTFDSPMCNV